MSETRQWVERFEALRDDLATGDLYYVQKWVQNDGALTEIAEGIARLARLVRELEEARERELEEARRAFEVAMEYVHESLYGDILVRLAEEGIDLTAPRTPRGEGEAWRAFLDALDEFETATNLWADPEGPTAADMERLRQSRQRVIECARALAARRGEGGGE